MLSIDESHIINLIENDTDLNQLYNRTVDYNLYPLKFELPGKYFKKLINDISIFSDLFTIEKVNNNPLRFIYKNINNTIKGYNICKDHSKLKLESTLTSDDIFSVSIRIDYIKALSNSLLSDTIKIYADKENDIIFNLLIDNGVFEILIYTTINKYI
jgi:hypothetical protein